MNPAAKRALERSRKFAGLARAYAQTRSLGVLIALLVFAVLFAAVGLLSYAGGVAYRGGNMALFWVCIAAFPLVVGAAVYVSIPKWGGQRLEVLARRFYPEGNVSIAVPDQKTRQRLGLVLAIAFGCCVLGAVVLDFFGYVPPKYVQPVSALYVVPFLVGLKFLMGPAVSYVSLLWPLLYGLHAILILADAPIVFTGRWQSLNIALPIVGYGLFAALVCHAYNRYAIYKLKQMTSGNNTGAADTERASQR